MDSNCGIVVIGRNEGERLRMCLESLQGHGIVVYVDSGSTDGSVGIAKSFGVRVHELDPSSPFSPARGRREGVEVLLAQWPNLRWIQFVDGDCALEDGWLEVAIRTLEADEAIGIVCGSVQEAFPESSIYNRMSPLSWKQPTGDIRACGGIFMIRRDVYEAAGGFDPVLLTREESDLCVRVKAAGYRIVRMDVPMVQHDSGYTRFTEWWQRAVWGGYGDALGISRSLRDVESRQRLQWYLTRPLGLPLVFVVSLLLAPWWPWLGLASLLIIAIYLGQIGRTALARRRQGDAPYDALLYAIFGQLRNLGCGAGFLKFFLLSWRDHRPPPRSRARDTKDVQRPGLRAFVQRAKPAKECR